MLWQRDVLNAPMQGSFCRVKESKEAGHCLKKKQEDTKYIGNIYLMIILQDINNLCSFDRKIYWTRSHSGLRDQQILISYKLVSANDWSIFEPTIYVAFRLSSPFGFDINSDLIKIQIQISENCYEDLKFRLCADTYLSTFDIPDRQLAIVMTVRAQCQAAFLCFRWNVTDVDNPGQCMNFIFENTTGCASLGFIFHVRSIDFKCWLYQIHCIILSSTSWIVF